MNINHITRSNIFGNVKTLFIHCPQFKYSCINITFKLAAITDTKNRAGINYLVYRLIMEKLYQGDFIIKLYSNGGILKCDIDKEIVTFAAQINSKDIYTVLEDMLSIFNSIIFTTDDLERLKQNIIAESHANCDDIYNHMFRITQEKSFLRQHISRPLLGKNTTIPNITADDVYEIFYKNYQSQNCVIVLAQKEDVDEDKIKYIVESSLVNKRVLPFNAPKKYRFVARNINYAKNIKNYYILYTYGVKGMNSVDETLKCLVIKEILKDSVQRNIINSSSNSYGLIGYESYFNIYYNIGLIHFHFVCRDATALSSNILKDMVSNIRMTYSEVYRLIQRLSSEIQEFYNDALNSCNSYAKYYLYLKKIRNINHEYHLLSLMNIEHLKTYMLEVLNRKPTIIVFGPRHQS